MNEQQNNTIEDSITLGDIFSALFCKKLIMLIITLAVTLIGTLGILLVIDRPRKTYTSKFNLNTSNIETESTYIDGSKFDYRDIISLTNLNKAKDSDSKFSKIDTNKLISSGAISIEKVVEYDENILKAENKAVVKNTYYKIVLKKAAIGNENIARSYVDALTNLVIKENISKAESMDYTADLISYDDSNRYDTQIEYLQNQFNLIINGYKSLKENFGNVTYNSKSIDSYINSVEVYFKDYTFANMQSELEQYGYIKDYNQNGRVYYTAVNNNVDLYNTTKAKLKQLEDQRDAVLDKYASMASTIENTGLDDIYKQIGELATSLEDIKQTIRVNLRRLASSFTETELKAEFTEAFTILECEPSAIISDSERGNVERFKLNLARFRTKLGEYTTEYQEVTKNIVSEYSTVYYNDSSIVVESEGLGLVKAALISLVAGFVIACVVNLILGRERLTFEYRMQQRLERAKKYGLVADTNDNNKE